MSLPLVTGKAAPEHRSHSVSSLSQPERKKKNRSDQETRIWATKRWTDYRRRWLPVCAFQYSARRTFHSTTKQRGGKRQTLQWTEAIDSQTNPSVFSTQLRTTERAKHTHNFESESYIICTHIRNLCIEKYRGSCHMICNWSRAIRDALEAYICWCSCDKKPLSKTRSLPNPWFCTAELINGDGLDITLQH